MPGLTTLKCSGSAAYFLSHAYPDLFNPATQIEYGLPEAQQVKVVVYNVLGEAVAVLVDAYQEAGRYRVTWDASMFSAGVYFYRLQAGQFVETRRTVLLK